jgi:ribosomal protein L15E
MATACKEPNDEPYAADSLDDRIGWICRRRASRRRLRGGQGQGDRLRDVPRAGGTGHECGKKDNAMMKAQTASLNADDMANLAAYYGSLK